MEEKRLFDVLSRIVNLESKSDDLDDEEIREHNHLLGLLPENLSKSELIKYQRFVKDRIFFVGSYNAHIQSP